MLKTKEYSLFARPLPFSVLSLLGSLDYAYESIGAGKYKQIPNTLKGRYWGDDAAAIKEAWRVLEMLGGVKISDYMQFDYNKWNPVACLQTQLSPATHTPEQKKQLSLTDSQIHFDN